MCLKTMMFRVTFGSTYQFIDLFILGLTSLSCWDFEHGPKCVVVTLGSFYFRYTTAAHFIARAIPSLDFPPAYSSFFILFAHYLVSSTTRAPSLITALS
jgi:hypothetical protein